MVGKPKPTALKLLDGNPGKRPLNKKEPKPDKKLPECPIKLEGLAKETWDILSVKLNRLGLLTSIDDYALATYCDAYADYEEARQKLQKEPKYYESENKNGGFYYVKNPNWDIKKQSFEVMRRLMVEFGMTPSSRSKISVDDSDKSDPFEDFINEKLNGTHS